MLERRLINFLKIISFSMSIILVLAFNTNCGRDYKRKPSLKVKGIENVEPNPSDNSKKDVKPEGQKCDCPNPKEKSPPKSQKPPAKGHDGKGQGHPSPLPTPTNVPRKKHKSFVPRPGIPNPQQPKSEDQTTLSRKNRPVEISISKTALDKEFMLQATLVQQNGTRRSQTFKSRRIVFRKKNNSLELVETSQQSNNHSSTSSSHPILATFPITSENDSSFYFDVNAGMGNLNLIGDGDAKAAQGEELTSEQRWSSSTIINGNIEDAHFNDANQLVLRQTGLITSNKIDNNNANHMEDPTSSSTNNPIEIYYYLWSEE